MGEGGGDGITEGAPTAEGLLGESRLTLDYHGWLRRPGRRLLWESRSRNQGSKAAQESSTDISRKSGVKANVS